jgi:hypothetical protein
MRAKRKTDYRPGRLREALIETAFMTGSPDRTAKRND